MYKLLTIIFIFTNILIANDNLTLKQDIQDMINCAIYNEINKKNIPLEKVGMWYLYKNGKNKIPNIYSTKAKVKLENLIMNYYNRYVNDMLDSCKKSKIAKKRSYQIIIGAYPLDNSGNLQNGSLNINLPFNEIFRYSIVNFVFENKSNFKNRMVLTNIGKKYISNKNNIRNLFFIKVTFKVKDIIIKNESVIKHIYGYNIEHNILPVDNIEIDIIAHIESIDVYDVKEEKIGIMVEEK